MKTYPTNEIKNVVLLGASGSGKTTLAEAMAFDGKVIDRRGSIETDSTLSDYTDIEHIYKRSIYPTLLFAEYNGYKLNIIDTPGADDFCGGLFSAFKVADVGVMLINAQNGFEVGSEIQARYARSHDKPIIAVINQLDSEKASWEASLDSSRAASQVTPVVVQYPVNPGPDFNAFIDVLLMKMYKFKGDTGIREELDIPAEEMERATELNRILTEAAAENDEALMELYFEKGVLTQDELRSGLKLGLAKRDLIPVFCASGKRDIGAKRLMEFIINVAPGPLKAPNFVTVDGREIEPDSNGPTALFVFKTTVEPHLGEVTYFRVVSGKVTEGMELVNSKTGNKEKISQLFAVAGKNRVKVTEMMAGDIGATVKLKNTNNGDTLNEKDVHYKFGKIQYPNPRFKTAVKAVNTGDEEKLAEILQRIHQEDPTFLVEYSKELKQMIISGQGEFHLNTMKWRIEHNDKLEIEFYPPRIPYRETITKYAYADYRHKKQSGGAGQFGEVHLVIEPYTEGMPDPTMYKINGVDSKISVKDKEVIDLPWGGKLVFYNCIVGGVIDARFMPAILKGIMEKMEEGPLTGSYARDIRVSVYDGKMHPVDSNEISFKLAGRHAFSTAFKQASPKILEPIYDVEVLVPDEYMGDVMGDLQTRRAIIMGMEADTGFQKLMAKVPLKEMQRYSTALSSITGGRATFTMNFSGYEKVPAEVQEELLKAYQEQEEDE